MAIKSGNSISSDSLIPRNGMFMSRDEYARERAKRAGLDEKDTATKYVNVDEVKSENPEAESIDNNALTAKDTDNYKELLANLVEAVESGNKTFINLALKEAKQNL